MSQGACGPASAAWTQPPWSPAPQLSSLASQLCTQGPLMSAQPVSGPRSSVSPWAPSAAPADQLRPPLPPAAAWPPLATRPWAPPAKPLPTTQTKLGPEMVH